MAVSERCNQNLTDSDTDANDSFTCSSAFQKSAGPRAEEVGTAIDLDEEIVHGMTASYTEISFNTQSSEPDDSILEEVNVNLLQDIEGPCELQKKCEEFCSERPNKLPLNNESGSGESTPSTNKAVGYLNQLNGTVTQEGEMVLFVAEDLEKKIKLSSPVSKKEEPSQPGTSNVWGGGSSSWLYKQTLISQLPVFDQSILNDLEIEVSKIATSVDTLTENLAGILHSVSALTVDCLETYRDVVCKTCDAVDFNIKSTYQLMAKCEELSKSMKPIYKLSEQIKEIKHFLDLFENAVN